MATELPIVSCTLDAEGQRRQAARYKTVAAHVTEMTRTDHSIIAAVDAEADHQLIEELVATEQACCPFLNPAWDGASLSFAVTDAGHAPALDVIAEALSR